MPGVEIVPVLYVVVVAPVMAVQFDTEAQSAPVPLCHWYVIVPVPPVTLTVNEVPLPVQIVWSPGPNVTLGFPSTTTGISAVVSVPQSGLVTVTTH